ncbi:MAG: hypothetical protein A2Y03_10185 [Omnitrophica WOR_2 bacterium GWF2_38_59]|nr:MAG: hypothetical protein A2Y03_10185 [Omnitrophica WOR_2 bacterium GWF2_38_59]
MVIKHLKIENIITILLPWFLVVFVPSNSYGEKDQVLSWQYCITETQQNNPELVSAREKLNQAKADKSITQSAILPQLSSTLNTKTSKTQGQNSTESYNYGVSGQQLLFDGFKTSNDLASAREKIASATYNFEVVSSNVRYNLWSAFINLLGAQELLNVTKDIADRRQQNWELVELRYKVGKEHKGSLLTAKANFSQAQYELEEAKQNVEIYQRRLSKLIGREKYTPFVVNGGLDIQSVNQEKPEFEKIVETTPLLKEVVAQKEAARFDLKSAKSGLFPQVYATAGVTKSGAEWPPDSKGWTAGLSVSLPLFEGGKQQAQISKARATLNQAQADERNERDDVILTLAETWIDWRNNVAKVSVREEFLEASQVRAMIAEGQYSTGTITFDAWTIIEDDLVSNQKALLQAKTTALISEAAWLQAKGVTLDE